MTTVQVLLTGALILLANLAMGDHLDVIYPQRIGEDYRGSYALALLTLGLDKSGHTYSLSRSDEKLTQSRSMILLDLNQGINVMWMGTSKEVEERYLTVRIPVYRGLLGYRLFIIHASQQAALAEVKTLEDLTRFRVGQGLGWSDIGILESAGFQVTASKYDNILRMIDMQRLELFPRGVVEIFSELENNKGALPSLQAEQQLLLVYPFAMYFFVSKHHPEIAEAIERGLLAAYADGSFVELFFNHPDIKAALDRANLKDRRRFDIPNPVMTQATLGLPDYLWFRP